MQSLFRKAVTLALAIVLAAGVLGSHSALAQVAVKGDKFSKDITFEGPLIGVNPFGGTSRFWRIRSWLNRDSKTATHQLYVDIGYSSSGWRFYEGAADDNANDLRLVRITSEVDSCSIGCIYDETVGVDLPDETLRAKAATGFQVKLSAKSGDSLILDVTAAQITAQLKAIDGYQAASGGSAQTPLALPPQLFGVDFGTSKPMWGLPGGALVGWINGESVAARAGVKWADSIIEWDGRTISSATDIQQALVTTQAGQKVPFKVLRARKIISLTAQF